MFADPPLFIRLLRRPCPNREDCFKKWSWSLSGDGVGLTCETCGAQFVSKTSAARLVFLENDEDDAENPRADLDKIKELTDENKEFRERLEAKEAETKKSPGVGDRTGYRMLVEPLK